MQINADMTINAAIQEHPELIRVFNSAGLDTCCAGGLPIGVAAAKHGLDVQSLLYELNAVSGADYESCCRLSGI